MAIPLTAHHSLNTSKADIEKWIIIVEVEYMFINLNVSDESLFFERLQMCVQTTFHNALAHGIEFVCTNHHILLKNNDLMLKCSRKIMTANKRQVLSCGPVAMLTEGRHERGTF